MNAEPRGRRTFTLRRSNNNAGVPPIAWRILFASFAIILFVWIGTSFHILTSEDTDGNNLRDASIAKHDGVLDLQHEHMLALDLELDPKHSSSSIVTIRITVFPNKCPKAYEFLMWMIENQQTECRPCTVYRGEPVPSYWGSKDYPDRWDNGGRWGPPYALVQGGFPNNYIEHIEREDHRPMIERGMVAWAGLRGVHFFVALAQHPEWEHQHTVWGQVVEEDMPLLDALVNGEHHRPLKVLEKNVPVVTNFVDPMPFKIREYS